MGRPHASWLHQVDQLLKEMVDGQGICLGDEQMEAPGVPAESGQLHAARRADHAPIPDLVYFSPELIKLPVCYHGNGADPAWDNR